VVVGGAVGQEALGVGDGLEQAATSRASAASSGSAPR
jgi:hypothetical protein